MKTVPFVKATACGNDFLLIAAADVPTGRTEFTRLACDRRRGIGADGVEWMSPGGAADLAVQLINADGSPAEISGNGTRCAAAYLAAERQDRNSGDRITVQTDAGPRIFKLLSHSSLEFEFESGMGPASVGAPVRLTVEAGTVEGFSVITGNPHFVIFVENFPADWQRLAGQIGVHSHFPEGVNVELVRIHSENSIEIRILERGAGETESSGTGSCASAVAVIAAGRVRSPVRVSAPGGTQTVQWENGEVTLTGPARLVCRGEYLWEE